MCIRSPCTARDGPVTRPTGGVTGPSSSAVLLGGVLLDDAAQARQRLDDVLLGLRAQLRVDRRDRLAARLSRTPGGGAGGGGPNRSGPPDRRSSTARGPRRSRRGAC